MTNFDKYLKLRNTLLIIRQKHNYRYSNEEVPILDEMTDIWYELTEEEQDQIYNEKAWKFKFPKETKMNELYLENFKGKSIPELEKLLSENGKKYRQIYYDWMKFRVDNPSCLDMDKESYYLVLLDQFYVKYDYDMSKLTELDVALIEYLPTPYDFLYH